MDDLSSNEDLYESFQQNAKKRFQKMEYNWQNELNEIVTLASEICETPAAFLLLSQHKPLFFTRFTINLPVIEKQLLCFKEPLGITGFFVAEDTLNNAVFANNPYVTGPPYMRFYAGAALINNEKENLGCLCVMDVKPRKLTASQQTCLRMLSKQAIRVLELSMSLKIVDECLTKINRSEVWLRAVFESTSSNHLLIGENFELLYFNKAVADFFKTAYGKYPALGDDFRNFMQPASMQIFLECFAKALRGEETVGERVIAYPNFPALWWEVIYTPAKDNNGNIIGVSLQGKNINDRKLFEEKIKSQNEQLKKIAQLQSHQVRGPLTTVMGLMNILNEDGARWREYLDMMNTAIKRLDDNIHSIVQQTINV